MTPLSMKKSISYIEYVRRRTQTNACLNSLAEHVLQAPRNKSRLHLFDIHTSSDSPPQPLEISEHNISQITKSSPHLCPRIILIEDISPQLISRIGEILDIDPVFFASHVITDFQDIEKAPLPPSLAMVPSVAIERGFLNIHYQQVLDLGASELFKDTTYSLKSDSNTPRNVRRLPPLSGRQIGLARGCCSMIVKKTKNISICLVLVDSPINRVSGTSKSGLQTMYPASRLHGGIEDFSQLASFKSTSDRTAERIWDNSSISSCLLHYFGTNPSLLQPSQPTILGLAYYPVRIILHEWNIYSHLISRYFKYYEYSMNDIAHRLHNDDIIDLQRWRRRSKQSQHKLIVLAGFIDYWLDQEPEKKHWVAITKDIRYLQRQMELYSQSLEQMVTVATSMIQILDSRRSILEAISIRRLTYIALVFIPLSWVASLFSMNEEYIPGKDLFWVYFAVGLPLVVFVLLLSAFPYDNIGVLLKKLQ